MSGPPRRRPMPYDAILAGVPAMLLRDVDDKGQIQEPIVSIEKAPTLEESAPTDYTYSAESPLLEKVAPFGDLYMGFGQRVQQMFQDRRYRKCLGVDVTGGTWVKGPNITTVTPTTTGTIVKFWEQGGKVFAAADKYILQSTDGINFVPLYTLAATITDVIFFHTNAPGGVGYSYIGIGGTGFMYRFDGVNAPTQHATLQAYYFAVVGREFYRTTGVNTLAKVSTDADPWIDANWTNDQSWAVGSPDFPITGLSVSGSLGLMIHKTDGIYTLDNLGLDHPLFPFLQYGVDSEGGKYWFGFDNNVHISYGLSHYRINPGYQLEAIGPNRTPTNDTEVYGKITCGAGHGEQGAYAILWNPELNESFLMKFGAWIMKEVSQYTGQDIVANARRIDEWHGSLSLPFAGMKGTAMLRTSVGASTSHYRMLIGFDNGQIASFSLSCRPNPSACSSYQFTTSNTEIYFPFWHGTFETEYKSLRAATVDSQYVDASNYVQIWYKSDSTMPSYTNLGTNFTVAPRQKVNFPDNPAVVLADFKMVFINAATTISPQINGWGLHHRVVLDLIQIFTVQVVCADRQVNRLGQPIHGYPAQYIRDTLTNAVKATGSFQIYLPDEQSYSVGAVKFKEVIKWSQRTRKPTTVMEISMIQFATATILGTWERVATHTWDEIAQYTWDQLLTI